MVDLIENIDCEFSITQKVQIINGFYKGHYGIIKLYDNKKKLYGVEIIIDNVKKTIGCKETDIRLQKGWFGK
jgi:ribosomal protein L21E